MIPAVKSGKPAIEGGKPIREKNNFLVFGAPYIGGEEIEEVIKTLKSCWIGTGPKVFRFEEEIRNYLGAKYIVALNSCTAALHLSMIALNIGKGDEVITTPMTFCATANAIIHARAKPIFVDINRSTLNIDPNKIEEKITEKTKAIIPVHFAGRPCDLESLISIAEKNNLFLIEDAAHALGAEYNGRKIGNFGHVTCFSFYVNKNITTGEGGLVSTTNRDLADKIRILRLHGISKDAWKRFSDSGYKHYFVEDAGFKYNMTDIQASLGIHQLSRIEEWHKRRVEIWKEYDNSFQDLPLQLPLPEEPNTKHSRHLYTIILKTEELTKSRDFILQALEKEGIGVGVHYTALHLHPFYRKLGYKKGDFPNAEYIGERTISLPLYPKLTDEDVKDVISAVTKVLNYYKK